MALKGLDELKAYQQKMLESATTAEETTKAEEFAAVVAQVEQDHEEQNKAWADKYKNAIRHTAIGEEPTPTIKVTPSDFAAFANQKLADLRKAKK